MVKDEVGEKNISFIWWSGVMPYPPNDLESMGPLQWRYLKYLRMIYATLLSIKKDPTYKRMDIRWVETRNTWKELNKALGYVYKPRGPDLLHHHDFRKSLLSDNVFQILMGAFFP